MKKKMKKVLPKVIFLVLGLFVAQMIITGSFYYSKADEKSNAVITSKESLDNITNKDSVRVVKKAIVGKIQNTLFETINSVSNDPVLIDQLVEVFAWQLDFDKSKKGDFFRVIYEENYKGNTPTGVKRILGVQYNHKGKDLYAINLPQNDYDYFYNEKGKPLQKILYKAPVEYSRISSKYTLKRYHPVQKRNKPHYGTDYAAPAGTPILAAGDGKVIASTYNRFNGNYVKIKHNNTYTTQYLHMSAIQPGIRNGSYVKQGDIIGYVGSTGLATGPHLCYRFWKNGQQIDPMKDNIPGLYSPVAFDKKNLFEEEKAEIIAELNSLPYPWSNAVLTLAS